jgi:hypothetical protein
MVFAMFTFGGNSRFPGWNPGPGVTAEFFDFVAAQFERVGAGLFKSFADLPDFCTIGGAEFFYNLF